MPWVASQLQARVQPVQLLLAFWRRASTTRDGPAQPPGTVPHRPADTLRSVPGAGGAIELALLCAAA